MLFRKKGTMRHKEHGLLGKCRLRLDEWEWNSDLGSLVGL
jgi:hypothetical protein